MPTLEELRRWLRGDDVPGLPSWEQRTKEEEPDTGKKPAGIRLDRVEEAVSEAAMRSRGRYTVDVSGDDARLDFGKFKGLKVSELAQSTDGARYLDWILEQEFPKELKEIIVRHRTFKEE